MIGEGKGKIVKIYMMDEDTYKNMIDKVRRIYTITSNTDFVNKEIKKETSSLWQMLRSIKGD